MRCYTIFLLFILSWCKMTSAQTRPASDTALAVRSRQLGSYLALSSAQEQALLTMERKQQSYMDSLVHSSASAEQRKSAMISELKEHDLTIKAVLTDAQWKKYKDMLAARRADFLKRSSDKHIQVQELPRQQVQ